MSQEIRRKIESFIQREKQLLYQCQFINDQKKDTRSVLGREAVNLVAREVFGRTGGKIVRSLINQGEQQRIGSLEAQVDSQHQMIVRNIWEFISSISEWKKNLIEPNSYTLLPRLEKAQEGVRPATRIRATIRILNNLKAKKTHL